MKRTTKTQHRGFTLAELLVTIGIIILFTAVLLPGIGQFGRRNELRLGAQLVQSKILEAKSYALAPRSTGGTSILFYQFRAPLLDMINTQGCPPLGRNVFAIVELTSADTDTARGGTPVVCERLPGNITFVTAVQTNVAFSVVDQGAIPPMSPEFVDYVIRHTRLTPPSDTRTIRIRRSTGQVTIQ